jgi:tRNA(Ser,Leu) C12 N-acetylase TAN1
MLDWNVVVSVKERGYTMARQILEEYGTTQATHYQNVLVMKVESPDELMSKLDQRLARNPDLLAYVSRIAPAQCAFDFATRQDFEERARDIALRWLPQLGHKSFHVRMHRRGLKAEMSSQTEERFLDGVLLQALEAAGTPATIGFEDPDAVIDIETVDKRAGMALWTRDDLRRYAFLRVD